MSYFSFNKTTLSDLNPEAINRHYAQGYVFERTAKGNMNQTRSLRIDLKQFELSSENRRILRKLDGLTLHESTLPLSAQDYSWKIHKLAKDFYSQKFGNHTFSANKVKELLTTDQSNFSQLLSYKLAGEIVGYCIIYRNIEILHYAYPFYEFTQYPNNLGMAMMIQAISLAKEQGLTFVYLGSATRPEDKYKLQFKGLEWFDGNNWQTDLHSLKSLL